MKTDQITVNTQASIRIGGSRIVYFDPFQIREAKPDARSTRCSICVRFNGVMADRFNCSLIMYFHPHYVFDLP